MQGALSASVKLLARQLALRGRGPTFGLRCQRSPKIGHSVPDRDRQGGMTMAYQHRNRCGDVYFLQTGEPVDDVPAGYEVYESSRHGQPSANVRAYERANAFNSRLSFRQERSEDVPTMDHILPNLERHVNTRRLGARGDPAGIIEQRL